MHATDTNIFADLEPTDPLMVWPWYDLLRFCLGQPDCVAQFRADTGETWELAGRTPLDRMIDTATGREALFFQAFAKWMNQTQWGEDGGRATNGGMTRSSHAEESPDATP